MSEKLFTLPQPVAAYRPVQLTGNHYLALPEIDPRTAGILSANAILLAARGLLEFKGPADQPLVRPVLKLDARPIEFSGGLNWDYRWHWVPHFELKGTDWLLEGEIFAPEEHRGAVYLLCIQNVSSRSQTWEVGWEGKWAGIYLSIFSGRGLAAKERIFFDDWTGSLVLEAAGDLPLAALALGTSAGSPWQIKSRKNGGYAYRTSQSLVVEPGAAVTSALYLAANLEADGARTTQVDLRRRGWASLREETAARLKPRQITTGDQALDQVLNRNLLFNYYFACGRALDTDETVMLTSRSPRYYVSGAFWARDALLWSFPGLLLTDRRLAREVLVTVFERHLKRAGEHAHYLNGILLYPGFELDQLCAYFLALKHYLDQTRDFTILDEEHIHRGLAVLFDKLLQKRDPQTGLYATFLDPADDPATYPFLTYDNALVWCSLAFLGTLQERGLFSWAIDPASAAAMLKQAVFEHCVAGGPEGTVFAWAVDGKGRYELYDNPPGSLSLLAHYGFVPRNNPVFRRTVAWIHSQDNPFRVEGRVRGQGSRHAGGPWPLAAASDLLALNLEGEDFFRKAAMDNGLASETVDPDTGLAATGLAFASSAGFIACAILNRYRQ